MLKPNETPQSHSFRIPRRPNPKSNQSAKKRIVRRAHARHSAQSNARGGGPREILVSFVAIPACWYTYDERGRSSTTPCAASARHRSTSAADVRVQALRRVRRNPPAAQARLVRPLVRVLRLPRPLHPARAALERARLRLPELAQERLVAVAEARGGAGEPRAGADARGARVRAVVPRADAAAVEVLGAVRRGGRPFADDRPEVE